MTTLYDGYTEQENAIRWRSHIDAGDDPFRESEGGTYDQIRRWLSSIPPRSQIRLFDGGCGEGITSFVALQTLPESAEVVGQDISIPLIEIATQSRIHPRLKFSVGDLGSLQFDDCVFTDAMAVNCIFHLSPEVMIAAFSELARITGPDGRIMVTNVDYEAYQDFVGAFTITEQGFLPNNSLPATTPFISGNPTVRGPEGTTITLTRTPFVMHPEPNLVYAINTAGLRIEQQHTFGPLSLVGGPDRDLFRVFWLRK